jgi:type II secretory pathway component PulL
MRKPVLWLVVVALVCVSSSAYGAEPPQFDQAAYEALKKSTAKELAERKQRIDNLRLSAERHRQQAQYYFGQAAMYGESAARHRAASDAIQADMRVDRIIQAIRPRSYYVQPMGRNGFYVTPRP